MPVNFSTVTSRVAGTMVVRSSSVRVIVSSNPSQVPPLLMQQEVGMYSTRGGSQGMYITFTSTQKMNEAEPTLSLKPRGHVTRNPKTGVSVAPQKDMCPPKTLKKYSRTVTF